MPSLLDGPLPQLSVGPGPKPWAPVQPPAPQPGHGAEWRGTAAQAVEESARRFQGAPVAFASADPAGRLSARATGGAELAAILRSVGARVGEAGPVYTVRQDGSVFNTVRGRTEYVPVGPASPAPQQARAPAPASSPAPAPAPRLPETHWYTRPLGALKMVGGALETAAGGALVVGGAATSEVGVGVPVAIGGGVVAAHGLDTVVSGARTLWYGHDVDTWTSQGLQAAGVDRRTANLVDAGIGVVGSLGASAGTRALAASGEEVGAVTVSFRAGLPAGHNVVGVTTEAGTQWTHLVVRDARMVEPLEATGSTVLKEGAAVVGAARAPAAGLSVTVPVTAARAQAALETATALRGPAGAYSYLGNNCATHAAEVLRSAGVATPWLTTPSVNLAAAALRSPSFVGPVSTAAAAANAAAGAAEVASASRDAGGAGR